MTALVPAAVLLALATPVLLLVAEARRPGSVAVAVALLGLAWKITDWRTE